MKSNHYLIIDSQEGYYDAYLFNEEVDVEELDEFVKYYFGVQIWNDSNVISTVYKLNCYIVNFINFVEIRWKEFEEDINYTILDRSRIKISALGKHPLFPNESIDLLRFTLEITRENEKKFINDATIELLLMFGNKTDKLSFSLKEHLERIKQS